jgi:hypothetical protein
MLKGSDVEIDNSVGVDTLVRSEIVDDSGDAVLSETDADGVSSPTSDGDGGESDVSGSVVAGSACENRA